MESTKGKYPSDGSISFGSYGRNRPQASYEEFEYLQKNAQLKTATCIFARKGGSTIKSGNNSIDGINLLGVTEGYNDIQPASMDPIIAIRS